MLLKLAAVIDQREPVLQFVTALLVLVQCLQLLIELTLAAGLLPVPLKQFCFLLVQFPMLMLEAFAFCLVMVLPALQAIVDERSAGNDSASGGESLVLLTLQLINQRLLVLGGPVLFPILVDLGEGLVPFLFEVHHGVWQLTTEDLQQVAFYFAGTEFVQA